MILHTIVLQATQIIIDTAAQTTPAAAVAENQELSLWYLIKEGGPLMIPLAICSIVALYVFIERLMAIRRFSSAPDDFVQRLKPMIQHGEIEKAKQFCSMQDSSIARIIHKGLSRIGKPFDVIEGSMEGVADREIYNMETRVPMLATIADIAPMFGFLGTIAGMIQMFYNVNTHGFSLESISSGIYTKMVTSAVGLIIGIFAYMGYKYLMAKIDKNINMIEIQTSDFIDALYEPVSK